MKLGRHFAKVRDVLNELGFSAHARYVERATMPNQRLLPLDEVDPDIRPLLLDGAGPPARGGMVMTASRPRLRRPVPDRP